MLVSTTTAAGSNERRSGVQAALAARHFSMPEPVDPNVWMSPATTTPQPSAPRFHTCARFCSAVQRSSP